MSAFLQQLPVDALWGVGPVTARRLRSQGIHRLVDVRALDAADLRTRVGSLADWLLSLAHASTTGRSSPIAQRNRQGQSGPSRKTSPTLP